MDVMNKERGVMAWASLHEFYVMTAKITPLMYRRQTYSHTNFDVSRRPHPLQSNSRLSKCNLLTPSALRENYAMSPKLIPLNFSMYALFLRRGQSLNGSQKMS